jgi:transcriptional regulator with XRE-family HTH domain
MRFGEHVRQARDRRGMTQKHVAELTGYAPEYVADLERSRRPVPDNVAADVARALAVPSDLAFVWAGKLPPDLRDLSGDESDRLAMILAGFREGR